MTELNKLDTLKAKIGQCTETINKGRQILADVQREVHQNEGMRAVYMEQLRELEAEITKPENEVTEHIPGPKAVNDD